MSAGHAKGPIELGPRRIDDLMPSIRRYALIVLAAGLLACVAGSALLTDHDLGQRLSRSYMTAVVYFVSIALGGLFFVIVQHLVKAGWSVAVRRVAEGVSLNVTWLAVLFAGVIFCMHSGNLHAWAGPQDAHHAAHDDAGDHAPLSLEERPHPGEGAHHELAGAKREFLSLVSSDYTVAFGYVPRVTAYFLLWIFLAWTFYGWSVKQDETKDVALTNKAQWWSPLAMIAFASTLSLFAFETIMSLDHNWYSTIFGIYFFAGCFCSFCAFAILVIWVLHRGGQAKDISVEHVHDLGKFMFAFIVFWAYIGFSQFMLIWYGNLPEETVWFLRRFGGLSADGGMNWNSGWMLVSIWLLLGHFVIPFFCLISRYPKRHPFLLAIGALWILAMHYVDMFWLIAPNPHDVTQAVPAPVFDFGLFLVFGAVFALMTAQFLKGKSLIPEGDPRLRESLQFENY